MKHELKAQMLSRAGQQEKMLMQARNTCKCRHCTESPYGPTTCVVAVLLTDLLVHVPAEVSE